MNFIHANQIFLIKHMKQSKPERQGWRERVRDILGLETKDGNPNMFLIRDGRDVVVEGIDFTEEVEGLAAELNAALDGLVPDYVEGATDLIMGWDNCRNDIIRRIEERKREMGL